MSSTPLPPPMRYVTTTSSATGESSNLFGGPVPMAAAGKHMKGDVWTTHKFPAEVAGEVDMAGKGVGMVGNFAPGQSAGMHFTASIDYGIVISGSIVHETSDSKVITMNAGDMIVQRGTLHAWHNRTDAWTRMLFVMIPSEEVLVQGKPLAGTQYK
ncbi:hypothetical protein RQP46_007231 [Phenoliferia psychrophenolica]